MSYERSDTLEVKVAAAITVVEHLIAICRGFESDEWLEKFLTVREALITGRLKDAVREEARLTCYTTKTKWVGSQYMERRLEEVMAVLSRHISYPNHSEPAALSGELPKDVTVDLEAEISARRAEVEAQQMERATVGYLKVTNGVFAGELVALRAGQTVIGRLDSCQICIEDSSVSRLHVSLAAIDARFFVTALSVKSPTYLNGIQINSEKTELKEFDRIQVRDHVFQFFRQVPNPREAKATPTILRPRSKRNAWKYASQMVHSKSSLDSLLEDISLKGLELVMAEPSWPGGPVRSWKIDSSELSHLSEICANPDDMNVWLKYADWLEGRDDRRAEFLRTLMMLGSLSNADERVEPLRLRGIDLWEQVDNEWCTAMLELRKSCIINCNATTSREPQVRFAFQCPNQWDSLALGTEPNVRFCNDCSKNVYFCQTTAEAETRAIAGNCIAVSSRLALQVETVTDIAKLMMWPEGMTLGLPILKIPRPLEQSPGVEPYQTWGDILFGKEE